MRHLHYKLSAAMLAIVLLLGGAFYQIDRYSVRMYYEELSQRLNSSLAMYVVNAEPLISDGEVNRDALSELANRAMVINPTAEIYLLAPDGTILGHALPPEEVVVDRIDVGPIRDLLSESKPLPIKGINPRNPGAQKVFSAFPVADSSDADGNAGYLYVVLGGAQYEAIAAQVSGSDNQRMVASGILLLVLAAVVAGTLLFSFLTRRLRQLTADVSGFTEPHFEANKPIEAIAKPRDEIDQLQNACHYMVCTIQQQLSGLKENDRLRRELVTNISHDLRTPLATMPVRSSSRRVDPPTTRYCRRRSKRLSAYTGSANVTREVSCIMPAPGSSSALTAIRGRCPEFRRSAITAETVSPPPT